MRNKIKKCIRKTWNAAKKVVKKTKEYGSKVVEKLADTIKDGIKHIEEFVENPRKKIHRVWNGITGKDKFNEAEKLMTSIEEKFEKAKYEYEKEITPILSEIEKKLNIINGYKMDIYNIHFLKFKQLANRLHNIEIKGREFLDYFDENMLEIKLQSGVRSRSEIYEIDFNNLSFKDIGLGIITLGFYSRKKAKQTLLKAQEEEARIDEEIEKMKSQIKKTKVVLESINNISIYFEQLIKSYEKLLNRFEYGISSQLNNVMFDYNYNGKLDFKQIPIIHIEEFQALFNLSIVLKEMATMGYLKENIEINKKDIQAVTTIQSKVDELELLVA